MKISIIVPVYNAERYIIKLIDSVLVQTYKNYELILVDDGSSDNSFDIMKNYVNNSRIFCYKKNNTGPGDTRKYGFEKATGDLIFFLDSDDYITSKDSLEKINKIFSKYNIDLLFFDREDIFLNDKCIIPSFTALKEGIHKIDDINESVIPGLGAKIFKRKIFNSNMFIESNVYEDLYSTYLYLDKCNNFYYTKNVFYSIFHDGSETLSSRIDNKKFYDSVNIINLLYVKINNVSLKKSIAYRMTNLFITYIRKFDNYKMKEEFSDIEEKVLFLFKCMDENKVDYNARKMFFIKNIIFKYYKIKFERKYL